MLNEEMNMNCAETVPSPNTFRYPPELIEKVIALKKEADKLVEDSMKLWVERPLDITRYMEMIEKANQLYQEINKLYDDFLVKINYKIRLPDGNTKWK